MKKLPLTSIRRFTLFTLMILIVSSANAGEFTENELKTFLDAKEVIFEDISVQMGEANWNVYSAEGDANQDIPKSRFYALFGDKELNQVIDTWFEKQDTIQDVVLKRRIVVWRNILTGARVDMDEKIYKLENKLEAWLAGPEDMEGRPSAEALDADILKLMKMRNKKAKKLGYQNYAEMLFEINDVGYDWFLNFVAIVDSATRKPCLDQLAVIKKDKNIDKITMMDFRRQVGQYYAIERSTQIPEDRLSALMKETIDNVGFNYDSMPIRFVKKQIPYGGNGLAIRIPDDFRVVILPTVPLSTWMHELGHGLQGMYTTIEHPILKGYEWCSGNLSNAYSEGMAETSARFIRNANWLMEYAGLTHDDLKAKEAKIKKYIPFYIRMWMNGFMFEVEMYKNLDQDIPELRNRLEKHYLFIDNPDNSNYHLSRSIMPVSYPVYLQNYLLANFVSWQVHETLKEKFGENYVFNKKVAGFIKKNLYESGELIPWQERLKKATGRELDIRGFLKSVGL